MKKFALFLAPLLAITFLTNCGGGNKYTISIKDINNNIEEQTLNFNENAFNPIQTTINVADGYILTDFINISAKENATAEFIDISTLKITPLKNLNFTIDVKTAKIPTPDYLDVTTSGTNMKYYSDAAMTIPLDRIKVHRNEDFVFYIYAENPTNDYIYVPPTQLEIKINDVLISDSSYSIEKVEGEFSEIEKKVTIKKEALKGDIAIHGNAVPKDYYQVQFPYFEGLEPIEESKTYSYHNQDQKIIFKAKNKIKYNDELLTAKNVFVNLTGKEEDWISPEDASVQDKITFNHINDEYFLIIKKDVVDITVNTVQLIARAKNFPILENFTWDQISELSGLGYSKKLFDVGDSKKIKIKDKEYQVRVIDLLKDKTIDGKDVVTFEFTSIIKGTAGAWNNKGDSNTANFDFIHNSNLNERLQPNGSIYSMIPGDLMINIKTVTKHVLTRDLNTDWHDTAYDTRLFPLSLDEIEGDEDYSYAYYVDADDYKRKKILPDEDPAHFWAFCYWLRSPRIAFNYRADCIQETGKCFASSVANNTKGVAPAFCI